MRLFSLLLSLFSLAAFASCGGGGGSGIGNIQTPAGDALAQKTLNSGAAGSLEVFTGPYAGARVDYGGGTFAAGYQISIHLATTRNPNSAALEQLSEAFEVRVLDNNGFLVPSTLHGNPIAFHFPYDATAYANAGANNNSVDVIRMRTAVAAPEKSMHAMEEHLGTFRAISKDFGAFQLFQGRQGINKVSVTSMSPATSNISGGGTINIYGRGFTNPMQVLIGGNLATNPIVVSASEIRATIPAGISGAASVEVSGDLGSATGNTFSYSGGGSVTLSSITPDTSDLNGADVTITGTGFNNAGLSLSLGGTPLPNFNVVSDTEITLRTPVKTLGGQQDLVATYTGGNVLLPMAYRYSYSESDLIDPEYLEPFTTTLTLDQQMLAMQGVYQMACYSSAVPTEEVGYRVLAIDADNEEFRIEDRDGFLLRRVDWGILGGLHYDPQSAGQTRYSVEVRIDQDNHFEFTMQVAGADILGGFTVESTVNGQMAKYDNTHKIVGYTASNKIPNQGYHPYGPGNQYNVTIVNFGSIIHNGPSGVVNYVWDGENDWLRYVSSTATHSRGQPEGESDLIELVINDGGNTLRVHFDNRLEGWDKLAFIGGLTESGTLEREPQAQFTNNIPDVFTDYAGTHQAYTIGARYTGNPPAQLPLSFESRDTIDFTIDPAGTITIENKVFTWDGVGDQFGNSGSHYHLELQEGDDRVIIEIDSDYQNGFQVKLKSLDVKDIGSWVFYASFDRPLK